MGSAGRGSARATRLVIGAVFVVLAAGSGSATFASSPSGCSAPRTGSWTAAATPTFPAGAATIVDYAVAATDPKTVYVANSDSVLVTHDAGCHWSVALAPTPAAALSVTSKIRQIAMGAADPATVYVALSPDSPSRPSLLRTTDGGRTWAAADGGLTAATGRPIHLEVAPSDAQTAYMVLKGDRIAQGDRTVEVSRTMWSTSDGGASWTRRTASPLLVDDGAPVSQGTAGAVNGVRVDPLDSRIIWLFGDFGLWVSEDGGNTARQILTDDTGQGGPISDVDLFDTRRFRRILAYDALAPKGYISVNGARSWNTAPAPGVIRSAASGRRYDELVYEADGRVYYLLGADNPPREITPHGQSVTALEVGYADNPIFWARTGQQLLRWEAPKIKVPQGTDAPPRVVRPAGDLSVPLLPPLAEPTLGGPDVVSIPAGGQEVVPFDLVLPGVRHADVDFVVDVSSSMSEEISGLRSALAGIASDLVASGIDAHFGVARFNTYDTEPYFRVLPMVPAGKPVSQALGSLVTSGGGTTKSQLEAITQAVTGRGLDSDGAYIPPHQDARFRKGSTVRIVLTATDEAFYYGSPSPSAAAVGKALRAADVKAIGLAFDNGDLLPELPGTETPADGLRKVALESGSLAPAGGVDCDADGTPDLTAGDPLVCQIPSANAYDAGVLAHAIVNLVRSIPNLGDLSLVAKPLAAPGGVTAQPQLAPLRVDFARYAVERLPLLVRCPASATPTTTAWEIAVVSGGAPVAGTRTRVHCGAKEVTQIPLIPPLPRPVRGLAVPPQPPSTSNIPNANANANPNPNTNSQTQAQSGLADDRAEEPELALANGELRDVDELAMARLSWGVGALTLTTMAGCCVAVRRRAERSPAFARG